MSASDTVKKIQQYQRYFNNNDSIPFTAMWDIGTRFRKEDIFLSICTTIVDDAKELAEEYPEFVLSFSKQFNIPFNVSSFVEYVNSTKSTLTKSNPILVYKIPGGYMRFDNDVPEFLIGDGSDGNSTLSHIVPVLNYFKESQIKEVLLHNQSLIIVTYCKDAEEEANLRKYRYDIENGKIT